jgi:hypothetical protein
VRLLIVIPLCLVGSVVWADSSTTPNPRRLEFVAPTFNSLLEGSRPPLLSYEVTLVVAERAPSGVRLAMWRSPSLKDVPVEELSPVAPVTLQQSDPVPLTTASIQEILPEISGDAVVFAKTAASPATLGRDLRKHRDPIQKQALPLHQNRKQALHQLPSQRNLRNARQRASPQSFPDWAQQMFSGLWQTHTFSYQ